VHVNNNVLLLLVQYNGAVIKPETSHVGLDRSRSSEVAISIPKQDIPSTSVALSTIDLSSTANLTNGAGVSAISTAGTIRQGFGI
jgi:hypothetical protein